MGITSSDPPSILCQRKYALRFSRMPEDDAEIIVGFALRYADSADGDVAPDPWPPGLAERLFPRKISEEPLKLSDV